MSLKGKLFTAVSMFALTCAMLLVGVWAVSSTSIEIGGTISFNATSVNARITGNFANTSEGTLTLNELVYSSTSENPDTSSWNKALSFNEEGTSIVLTMNIENVSTERALYVSIEDKGAYVANLARTMKQGSTNYYSGNEVEIPAGETKSFTLTFALHTTDNSLNGSYAFKVNLNNESSIIPVALDSNDKAGSLTYSLSGTSATVIAYDESETDVVIPSHVSKGGTIYTVTAFNSDVFDGVGEDYMYEGTALTSIVIPGTIKQIPDQCFMSIPNLNSITFLEGVESLPGMFNDYANIGPTINIPASVTNISSSFGYCTNGSSINIAPANPKYHVENQSIIESATRILIAGVGGSAIPEGIVAIGSSAFCGIALGQYNEENPFIIPASVKSIGDGAFDPGSPSNPATCFKMMSSVPPTVAENIFCTYSNITIKVPQGSLSAYQTAWAHVIEYMAEQDSEHLLTFEEYTA